MFRKARDKNYYTRLKEMIKKIKKETGWTDIFKVVEEAQIRLKVKKRGEKKDFLEEAEKEKKELNESYQESVRQANERKE